MPTSVGHLLHDIGLSLVHRAFNVQILYVNKSFLFQSLTTAASECAYMKSGSAELEVIFKCERTQHCWPTTRNIVGSNMLRPFVWNHNNVGTCCRTCCVSFETGQTFRPMQTDATQPTYATMFFVLKKMKISLSA